MTITYILFYIFQDQSQETPSSATPTPSSANPAASGDVSASQPDKYDLVDSLLSLSKSEDSRVAVKSCEGLLLLVSMPHEAAVRAIVEGTTLCPLLCTRLLLA